MPKMVIISRISDHLPLTASIEQNKGMEMQLDVFKNQAKQITQTLTFNSPARCSIDTDAGLVFHYLIDVGIVYLTLADKSFPAAIAFQFLQELQREFADNHGNDTQRNDLRPYQFIMFDVFIQKTKKLYMNTRNSQNLARLNEELQGVNRVMQRNIAEVLNRGEKLDTISSQSERLAMYSQEYEKKAKQLNLNAWLQKYGLYAGIVGAFILLIMIRVYIF